MRARGGGGGGGAVYNKKKATQFRALNNAPPLSPPHHMRAYDRCVCSVDTWTRSVREASDVSAAMVNASWAGASPVPSSATHPDEKLLSNLYADGDAPGKAAANSEDVVGGEFFFFRSFFFHWNDKLG